MSFWAFEDFLYFSLNLTLTQNEDEEIRHCQVEQIVISCGVHGLVLGYHHACDDIAQNSSNEDDEVTDADRDDDG